MQNVTFEDTLFVERIGYHIFVAFQKLGIFFVYN